MSSSEENVEPPVNEPRNDDQPTEEEDVEDPAEEREQEEMDEQELEASVEEQDQEQEQQENGEGENDDGDTPEIEETGQEAKEEAQQKTTEVVDPQSDSIYQRVDALGTEAEERLDAATSALNALSGLKEDTLVEEASEVAPCQETQTIQEEGDSFESVPATSAMLKKQRESEGWLSTLDVEAILSRKTEVDTYTHACKELCIVPTSFFAKRIATREIIMAHHGLGPKVCEESLTLRELKRSLKF
jgi:hypothetical protein